MSAESDPAEKSPFLPSSPGDQTVRDEAEVGFGEVCFLGQNDGNPKVLADLGIELEEFPEEA